MRVKRKTSGRAHSPKHDIIVIGASAGGVEALRTIVADLPEDLQAAVFVVLHIGTRQDGRSYLPHILSRAGPLKAVTPSNGQRIQKGRIYVAPPDYHLMVEPGTVHLCRGPKENRARPSINPLFRSAAAAYEGRVTGVILTGMLDDGIAGLAEIKRRGGLAVVQDPETATFPSMPNRAIDAVDVDYVLPPEKIGPCLRRLTMVAAGRTGKKEPMKRTATILTCPECRGPLTEERQGRIVEYRCRVGHVYSAVAMAAEHNDTVERSLWASIVALQEAADIAEHLGSELGPGAKQNVRENRRKAAVLTSLVNDHG